MRPVFRLVLRVGIVLLALLLFPILLLLIVVFIFMLQHHIEKIQFGLPWLRWLTLEEITAKGYSKLFSPIVLMLLYDNGQLEVRLRGDLYNEEKDFAERFGFKAYTAEFYEFRLTKRGGRKRRLKPSDLLAKFQPAWKPAAA